MQRNLYILGGVTALSLFVMVNMANALGGRLSPGGGGVLTPLVFDLTNVTSNLSSGVLFSNGQGSPVVSTSSPTVVAIFSASSTAVSSLPILHVSGLVMDDTVSGGCRLITMASGTLAISAGTTTCN